MNTTALDARLLTCSPGAYPWDDWERSALASGLAAELANLGRAVMREAYNHAWCERLKRECGWCDAGRLMLRRVLAQPERTAARWRWLLETDGQRFEPESLSAPGGTVWRREWLEDSPVWARLRKRWDHEQAKAAAAPTSSLPAAVSTALRLIPEP